MDMGEHVSPLLATLPTTFSDARPTEQAHAAHRFRKPTQDLSFIGLRVDHATELS